MARTFSFDQSSRTCARTRAVGTGALERSPAVDCTVTTATAPQPHTEAARNARRSAKSPAPAERIEAGNGEGAGK